MRSGLSRRICWWQSEACFIVGVKEVFMRSRAALSLLSLFLLSVALAARPGWAHSTQEAPLEASCRVSVPNFFGNGKLWTSLWPDGTVIFRPGGPGDISADGSLSMKWPWWRGTRGKLTIEGKRLDGSALPLPAYIPEGYGDTGFQSTALIFPTEGCWEVTGKVGEDSLTFVPRVVRMKDEK